MRLIDADALIMQMNDGPYNCPGDCGACDTDEIIIDGRKLIACSAVTHTPTIDAIPVEWLEQQADYSRSEWDYDTCEGIRIVLKAWKKEQEAR